MRPPVLVSVALLPFVLIGLLLPAPALSQGVPGAGVLFQDHEPLILRIVTNFDGLKDDRDDENDERPGIVYVLDGSGDEEGYEADIRTRGRFRLQSNICHFPPLRLDFPRSRMDGSVFEDQDKLKLVTHCRDDRRYEQNTIKEYLAYRIYNLITDRSFQARLARITYVDSSGENEPLERWAFIIEAEEELAERLDAQVMEDPYEDQDEAPVMKINPARITGAYAAPVDLFAYMVGNTDFSIYGMHNVVLFEPEQGSVIPIPYDFDWTGLVNAPYARPDPSLRLRNVRQRIFRGLCRPDIDYQELFAHFLSRKEAVTALVAGQPQLGDDEREDVLDYLEDFWETLEDPGDARRRIEEACRAV